MKFDVTRSPYLTRERLRRRRARPLEESTFMHDRAGHVGAEPDGSRSVIKPMEGHTDAYEHAAEIGVAVLHGLRFEPHVIESNAMKACSRTDVQHFPFSAEERRKNRSGPVALCAGATRAEQEVTLTDSGTHLKVHAGLLTRIQCHDKLAVS